MNVKTKTQAVLKAQGVDDDGEPLYVLGFGRADWEQVIEDDHVTIDLNDIGIAGTLQLHVGETLEEVQAKLMKDSRQTHVPYRPDRITEGTKRKA